MCSDGNWHCQIEFWNLFIRSPHKRRSDIVEGRAKGIPKGRYTFEETPCIHGVKNGKDYRIVKLKELEPVNYKAAAEKKSTQMWLENISKDIDETDHDWGY